VTGKNAFEIEGWNRKSIEDNLNNYLILYKKELLNINDEINP
jgi:hypothetical protein